VDLPGKQKDIRQAAERAGKGLKRESTHENAREKAKGVDIQPRGKVVAKEGLSNLT